jgi:hypothetical protein
MENILRNKKGSCGQVRAIMDMISGIEYLCLPVAEEHHPGDFLYVFRRAGKN